MFPFPLTTQQQAERCGCGRFLAWPRTQEGHGSPRCCRCMQPADQCACQSTRDPDEGCLGAEFLADPADCE